MNHRSPDRKKTDLRSVVLVKQRNQKGQTLICLITDHALTPLRDLVVYTHTNYWFLAGEKVARKIGMFVKKLFLRRFLNDPNQHTKVLGVYDPQNERLGLKVDRYIRRVQAALLQFAVQQICPA